VEQISPVRRSTRPLPPTLPRRQAESTGRAMARAHSPARKDGVDLAGARERKRFAAKMWRTIAVRWQQRRAARRDIVRARSERRGSAARASDTRPRRAARASAA
jgi:hypothetical protein